VRDVSCGVPTPAENEKGLHTTLPKNKGKFSIALACALSHLQRINLCPSEISHQSINSSTRRLPPIPARLPCVYVPNKPLQLRPRQLSRLHHLLAIFPDVLARADVMIEPVYILRVARCQESVCDHEVGDDGRGGVNGRLCAISRSGTETEGGEEGGPVGG
jgi:hypothetical protein